MSRTTPKVISAPGLTPVSDQKVETFTKGWSPGSANCESPVIAVKSDITATRITRHRWCRSFVMISLNQTPVSWSNDQSSLIISFKSNNRGQKRLSRGVAKR